MKTALQESFNDYFGSVQQYREYQVIYFTYAMGHTYGPSDKDVNRSYKAMLARREPFERLLYSINTDQIKNIDSIREQYKEFASNYDAYIEKCGPNMTITHPTTGLAFSNPYSEKVVTSGNRFRAALADAQVTVATESFVLSEPHLVTMAAAVLTSSDLSAEFEQNTISSDDNATLSTVLNH